MILMISINQAMETLSIKFGLELQSARIVIPNKPTYDIRVGNIAQSQNFSLRLVRNWKATEVRFQADPFAADFVSFLNARIIESRSAIMNIRDERKRFYSRFTLEIEGLPFESVHRNNGEGGFDPEKFCFEVDFLSDESSLSSGLLTEQEFRLLETAVSIIAVILPPGANSGMIAEEVTGYPEGASTQVQVNKYERDPRNRRICIAHFGTGCQVCGFEFSGVYGPLGDNFIVVHHTVPVSKMGPNYQVDALRDLVPLCANCHAMVHRTDPPLSVDELRTRLSRSQH
jgi:5-methylcytosine-specific restriction protein A